MARKAAVKGAAPIIHDDIGFDLERLFDKYNMDHIPVKQRLEGFAQRDLPHIKHYKAAVNIFGGPMSRKRVIIAPPMETPLKRKLGMYLNQRKDPPAPALNSQLKSAATPARVMSSAEALDEEENEKEASFKQWYGERQSLRANLDGMGLSEALLQRKANKSELEKRVETRLRAIRLWKPESPPPPEPEPEEKEPPVVPSVKVPVPTALQTLDRFLTEKKIRLIDLFRNADTNKDWKLNKEELLAAVKKYQIPLTSSDIEDLMVTLDHNFDEMLDFKEVSQGLAALKMERRAHRRQDNTPPTTTTTTTRAGSSATGGNVQSLSSPPTSKMSGTLSRERNSNQNSSKVGGMESQKADGDSVRDAVDYNAEDEGEEEGTPENRAQSASGSASASHSGSTLQSRSSTPSSLEPPPPDLQDERRRASSAEEMLELRKHDKAVLERSRLKKWPWPSRRGKHEEMPGVIRIGHKEVDNHCMESTLEGEMGELMNSFRRSCLREYFQAVRLCEEKGVVLTPELLDRVLLYPAEIPRQQLMKKLALPKGPRRENFAWPPKKPKMPPKIRHNDKKKRTIEVHHIYPLASRVTPVVTKENLSTGRAMVARRADIWMTFEEYNKYTKHLPQRYSKLNVATRTDSQDRVASSNITGYSRYKLEEDKFWPGYMLDKLTLYEPGPDCPAPWEKGGMVLFHHTGQPPHRGNLGHVKVTGPPVNQDGRILQYGIDWHRLM